MTRLRLCMRRHAGRGSLLGLVLAALAFRFDAGWLLPTSISLVAILTLLSIAFYVAEWIRHVGANGTAH